MSDGHQTVLRLSDVTRELREHFVEHHAEPEGGCGWCDLWRIYTHGQTGDLDRFIERAIDQPLEMARAIRSEWGEAGWTGSDLLMDATA